MSRALNDVPLVPSPASGTEMTSTWSGPAGPKYAVVIGSRTAPRVAATCPIGPGSYPVNAAIPIPDGKLTMNLGGGDATLSTDGGNLNQTIPSTQGARNVITVSTGGGDISLSESSSR